MDSTSRANIITTLSVKNFVPRKHYNNTVRTILKHIQKILTISFLTQMYIIIHLAFTLSQFIYLHITNNTTKNDIIISCITLSILLFILLIYIFTHIRTWYYVQISIALLIYVIYYYQFFFISSNTSENTHKFYFLLVITNFTIVLCLVERHFEIILIYLTVVLLGNVAVAIYFSILYHKFAIESLDTFYIYMLIFMLCNVFLFFAFRGKRNKLKSTLSYMKTNTINSCINNDNENNSTLKLKEFCQMLNMGCISCKGEKFEVVEYNDIIKSNFQFLIFKKNNCGEILRKNNYTSREYEKGKPLTTVRNKPLLKPQKTFIPMKFDDKEYFDVQFFSQKKEEIYINDNNNRKDTLFSTQKVTLIELINIHKENNKNKNVNQLCRNFVNLGLFKFSRRSISIYFNIFMKYIPNTKSPKKDLFEFILNEIPSQKANKVILSNYENTLKKIAHEIKTPSMNIQKITEMLLKDNEPNKTKGATLKSSKHSDVIPVYSEQLQTIKYLSEICLLTVRDIVEHASLLNFDQFKDDDNDVKDKEEENMKSFINKKSSFVSLKKFVCYVKQLAKTYLFMLNKKVEIDFLIPKAMNDSQIIIDEQKLNQVISNLLTNAIKSTPENKRIVFTLSLLESNNYCSNVLNQTDYFDEDSKSQESEMQVISERIQMRNNSVIILGIRITLEDSGTGMDFKNMREINDKHIHEVNEIHDYSETKGIGSGIKISKKLCDEMGVEIKCELITREGFVKVKTTNNEIMGTKITLDIIGEIFPGSSNNDSIISEKTRVESNRIYNISPKDKILLYNKSENNINSNSIKEKELFYKADTSLTKLSFNEKGIFSKMESSNNIEFKRSPSDIKDLDSSESQLKDKSDQTSFIVSELTSGNKTKNQGFQRMNKKKSTYSKDRKVFQNQIDSKKYKFLSNNNISNNSNLSIRSPQTSNTVIQKIYKHRGSIPNGIERSVINFGNEDSFISKPSATHKYEIESVLSDMRLTICNQATTGDYKSNNGSDDQDLEIIIVDDDSNITDSIKRILNNLSAKNNYSFKVKIFNDGIELLYDIYSGLKKNITTNKVILCDEMMKYVNGSEAYSMIVKYFDVVLKSILFISISAFSDGAHKKKLGQMGVEHIYEKPMTKGNIEYIFNNIVKKKFPIQSVHS